MRLRRRSETQPRDGHMRAALLRWAPAAIWMALIFLLSAQPALPRAPDDMLDILAKKVAHFGEYLILALLICRAMAPIGAPLARASAGAAAVALLYALSDEIHQAFVPGRNPSAADLAVDAIGAAVGIALFRRWRAVRVRSSDE